MEYSFDGDASNSDPYPIIDSVRTIPITTTSTGNEIPVDLIVYSVIGIVIILLTAIGFLKRRS